MSDYYQILGIARDADPEAIKRAYRRLALQYHPDRQSGEEAQARFRAAAEAYRVLGSPERRALYDLQGELPFDAEGDPNASVIGLVEALDLFMRDFGGLAEEIAGSAAGGSAVVAADRRRSLPLVLTLTEAFLGTRRTVPLPCRGCQGLGSENGSSVATVLCTGCGGSGIQRQLDLQPTGPTFNSRSCPDCDGKGRRALKPCQLCGGNGRDAAGGTVRVNIPPGIAAGEYIKVEHVTGDNGARRTELVEILIDISEDDPPFRRRGSDVLLDLSVTHAQAALGGEIEVTTLAGPRKLRIPTGSNSGHTIRLQGFGLPRSDGLGSGDQLIRLHVLPPLAAPTPESAPSHSGPAVLFPSHTESRRFPGTPAIWLLTSILLLLAAIVAGVLRSGYTWDTLPSLMGSPFQGGWWRLPRGAWALVVGVSLGLLGSAAIAGAEHRFGAALLGARDRLRQRRTERVNGKTAGAWAKLGEYVDSIAAHPPRTVAAGLDRLSRAIEQAGRRELGSIERLEERLAANLVELRNISSLSVAAPKLAAEARAAGPVGRDPMRILLVLAFAAVALMGLNSWLVAIAAPQLTQIPLRAPSWSLGGGLLPVTLALFAMTLGAVLYNLDSIEKPSLGLAVMKAGPNLLILGLVLLQTTTYVIVAQRLDVAGNLGLPPEHALFSVVQYAIVFVGAVVPLLLATLGYGMWHNLERHFSWRSSRSAIERLARNSRALERLDERLRESRELLNRLQEHSHALPRELAEEFRTTFGLELEERANLAAAIRKSAAELVGTGTIHTTAPKVRSRAQVLASIGLQLSLLGLWLLLTITVFRHFAAQLANEGSIAPSLTLVAAAGAALALGLAGFITKDALWGSAHLVLWSTLAPHRWGRRAVAGLGLAILAIGTLALGWSLAAQLTGSLLLVAVLYTLLLMAGLVLTSLSLDAGLVAAQQAAVLLWLGGPCAAVALAVGVFGLAEAALGALHAALRVAVQPAGWIGLRRPALED